MHATGRSATAAAGVRFSSATPGTAGSSCNCSVAVPCRMTRPWQG